MECLKSNPHRDPVVVVRHTTPSKVASNQLNLHFRANFGLKNVGKVAKLVRPTAYKLVEINELRHFSLLGRKSAQKWILLRLYLIQVFPVVPQLSRSRIGCGRVFIFGTTLLAFTSFLLHQI